MSTGSKKTWETRDTWRSLAFDSFQESGQWRYLVDLNPSYDIRYHPAAGTEIYTSGQTAGGKNQPSVSANPGTLVQVDTNLNLTRNPEMAKGDESPGYFPWSDAELYSERAGQYTAQALFSEHRINGYSLDSPQASSDSQLG